MKVSAIIVTANGVPCLLTDMSKQYNPSQNPTFIQSWGPDPNRTIPPIGPWEQCSVSGAVITFSGNGVRTYVLIPA